MKRFSLYLLAALATVLCSCEHKELCYHHPHEARIRVVFDWKDAPEANPRGMCVLFYPETGGAPVRYDFAGAEGGYVTLTAGKYRVLSYNNDTEAVLFYNYNSYDTHGAYTREGNPLEPIYGNGANYAPRAAGTEDERVVICPDMMWGSNTNTVEIDGSGVCLNPDEVVMVPRQDGSGELQEEYIIKLYPHELTCIYTYEVRNVNNLAYMDQMCGTISGMAGAMTFSTEALPTECVTLPFESYKYDDKTVVGTFFTFGHNADNTEPHKMAFYVVMSDGGKYVFKDSERYNVTDQVNNAPNRRRVHIIIDGLDLPTPITGDSGFSPSVDDWIDENYDIEM